MTKVRDVAAGPMRLRSRWLKAKSSEKKLSARQTTPSAEAAVGDDGCGCAEDSAALADDVEVADLAHGGGGEDVAGGRGDDDGWRSWPWWRGWRRSSADLFWGGLGA